MTRMEKCLKLHSLLRIRTDTQTQLVRRFDQSSLVSKMDQVARRQLREKQSPKWIFYRYKTVPMHPQIPEKNTKSHRIDALKSWNSFWKKMTWIFPNQGWIFYSKFFFMAFGSIWYFFQEFHTKEERISLGV